MSSSEPQPLTDLPMSTGGAQPADEAPIAAAESNPIRDAIAKAIDEHKVILFMKGTPEAPACGFSARTVAVLQALDAPFAAVDVLPDPRIRQELSAISNWPTIPQLFANGELVGGCDIVTEMYESGELAGALGLEDRRASQEPPPGQEERVAPGLTQIENRLG
jgi:monothiol glutaredoxin